MAKRRAAEPLAFHAPWKRLLLRGFPDEPPRRDLSPPGPGPPRKRRGDAGSMAEPAAAPSKRRGGGDGGAERPARGPEPGPSPPAAPPAAPEPRDARAPRGGGDGAAGRGEAPRADGEAAPPQHGEEFWQYNTFQFWRNPLPRIDPADIEDACEDSVAGRAPRDEHGVVEVDMES